MAAEAVASRATPASVLLMAAAVAVAWLLGRGAQEGLGLTPPQRRGLGFAAFCGGFLGAKLPFALLHPAGPLAAPAWLSDGRTVLGGLVGGYLAVEAAKALFGVTVKTGDGFAVPVAAAVGVGRLSCLFARCCYGVPTALPWAVDFGDGLGRHPTQAYEAAFHLAAACALSALRRRGLFPRQLMKLYILAYLAYRFLSEFIRPEPRLLGPLSAYQAAALALAPVFAGLWVLDAHAPAPEGA
ncbi:MAG: prolipoprotein diacylglyceryl transferase [Elusimicrobia bacterium]|nr:prolipoprotein diacylglyceryl transferase [Elusimicrobiota bacterium]